VIGIKMFLKTDNPLIVLGALVLGALLGEWGRIEDRLQSLGELIEKKFASRAGPGGSATGESNFVRGFMVSSLLFCIGPMAILGSIQDGLTGDYQTLAIKSVLDGFAALAFASTFGVGVLFSAVPLLVYQGGISLLAAQLNALLTPPMMTEMTATGGVILTGLAVSSLLEIKRIRVGSFLPSLVIAPVLVWLVPMVAGLMARWR
jgi:uncharacterized membrane protein YqgA involved in biofilm formation